MTLRFALCCALAIVSLWGNSATAQSADDRAALSGLNEVKIIFDLTSGDAERLSGTLAVIEQTRESLIKQGVTPHIVLAFRGGATKLVQTDLNALTPEQRKHSSEVAKAVKALGSAKGIAAMEQCAIAAKGQGVKPERLLPGIKLVGNGWVSLAAYQAKGYSYISP
jgi:intracellular sulfur oxidation DsrE/DsrF family protein